MEKRVLQIIEDNINSQTIDLNLIEKQAEELASYEITGEELIEYLKSIGVINDLPEVHTLNINKLTKEFFIDFLLGIQLYRFLK